MLNTLSAVSQGEGQAIGEHIRDAMNPKRTNGELVGNIRFGYRLLAPTASSSGGRADWAATGLTAGTKSRTFLSDWAGLRQRNRAPKHPWRTASAI